jgi:hypothetical protein
MEKEGLQAAIDFTKVLLTLAGGAIAFIIQPTYFAGSHCLKTLSILALVSLTVCVVSGLIVFSGGSVMLANKDYDIERNYIKIPGMVNVISFGLGFVLLAIAVAIKVINA